MTTTARLQGWTQNLLKRAFGLHVSRKPPFDEDPLWEIRRLRQWAPGDVIFDVGANDGRTVEKLQKRFPLPRIFTFEPVAATFQQLSYRTAGMKNVWPFQMALGAESGERTIYTGRSSVLNSFSSAGWEPSGRETVQVSTVDRMAAELGIDYLHFLKLDTEGHDLEVLRGAEESLSRHRIGIVQVEVGFNQHSRPVAGLDEVSRYLAARDYSLFGVFNQCRNPVRPSAHRGVEDSGRCVPNVLAYCDAVFVSNDFFSRKFG
jgi:FkbM family methyltransferase